MLTIVTSIAIAQKTKVQDVTESFGGFTNPGFAVTIMEADADLVEQEWKSFLKSYGGTKSNKGGEIVGKNAKIGALSDAPITIFAKIKERSKTETNFSCAFVINGSYLNPSNDNSKAENCRKMIYDFAVRVSKMGLAEQIKREEKEWNKLSKQQKGLVDDKTGLEKDVVEYQNKIKKAQQDIENNVKDQQAKQKDIDIQKKIIDDLKIKGTKID